MDNKKYKDYIDDLLEAVMVKKFKVDDPDIDIESYIEVEALSDNLSGA